MADNYTTNPGSGGSVFASDDVGGVQVPRVKLTHGVDGVANDANMATPMPAASIDESSSMTVAGLPVVPKFAVIAASASGATAAVAAVAGKKIRVLSYVFVAADVVNVKFQNATTDITGAIPCTGNSGVAAAYSPVGHFETAATAALNINLSLAIAVSGHLTYIEV